MKAYCRVHHVDEATTHLAVLLISEVVTNAVLHGHGTVGVALSGGSEDALHAEVEDDHEAAPVVGDFSIDRTDGRGLAIVASCAQSWGVRRTGASKIVWFEL